jgi:tetratricopeptide (TPR) repeat protein
LKNNPEEDTLIISKINILQNQNLAEIIELCDILISKDNVHSTNGVFKKAEAFRNKANYNKAKEIYDEAISKIKLRKLKSIALWDRGEIKTTQSGNFSENDKKNKEQSDWYSSIKDFIESYQDFPSESDEYL